MVSAGSPCAKATWSFFRLRIFLPNPALARKVSASKTVSPFFGRGLGVCGRAGFAILPEGDFAERNEATDGTRFAGGPGLRAGMPLALISYLRRATFRRLYCTSEEGSGLRFLFNFAQSTSCWSFSRVSDFAQFCPLVCGRLSLSKDLRARTSKEVIPMRRQR